MTMNKIDLQQTMDRRLSALRWTQDDSRTVLEQLKGEQKVKKKLSLGLVLALILILAATAALAAFALNRAPQADIVNRARQALYGKYGLNAQTVGLFTWSVEKQGDTEAVTFTGDGYHVSLLGVYTVVFDKDGKASASWSYDDADKALYESGDMSCPIWAQKQMAAALSNPEKASEISVALYKAYQSEHKERPAVTPQPIPDLKEGETWWQGEILRAGTPGENDMSKEEAIKIAQAVILEDYGFSEKNCEVWEVVDENVEFNTRENKHSVWGISVYAVKDGVEMGIGVVLDAQTGEVLLSNIITGGNG